MDFLGTGETLTSFQISSIGAGIDCGEDHMHTIMEVETRGGGFDSQKRLKMLYEPHVFWRELRHYPKLREIAQRQGLAYKNWGEKKYPRDSYPRLIKAMGLLEEHGLPAEKALRSCSWGLGQIMGFNHLSAGYSSARSMVEDFKVGEKTQLQAMVNFIVSSGLDDDLRREDWHGFARGYNGPGYKKHGYHTKLRKAFEKWRSIPDSKFSADDIDRTVVDPNPASAPEQSLGGPTLRIGSQGISVEVMQAELHKLRYFVGKVDGRFGKRTRGAVLAFQADNGLETDGVFGPLSWAAILEAEPRDLRKVTEVDLDDSGTMSDTRRSDRLADVVGIGSAAAVVRDAQGAVSEAQSAADSALSLWETVQPYWPLAAVAVGFLVWRGMNASTRKRRLQDAITGAHDGR